MTLNQKELVSATRKHAEEHYDEGGWDAIVECWSDEEILKCIGKVRTAKGVIAKVGIIASIYAERQADARIEGAL